MNDIGPIGSAGAAALGPAGRPGRPSVRTEPPARRGSDSVELSQHARLLSKLAKLPDIRQDLVDRVRQQIADGTYETAEKIDIAIDNLIEDL